LHSSCCCSCTVRSRISVTSRCHRLSLPAGRVYQRALLRMRDLLTVELVNVAHLRWAQITKRAYFTKA